MRKIGSIFKNKRLIVVGAIIFFTIFISLWNVVADGYDKQNKTILFLKKFIPTEAARKVRDLIFIIPDLKERNKFLSNQVEKYEQGLEGKLFNSEIILSKKKSENIQ